MTEQQKLYMRFVQDTLRNDGHYDESWLDIDWADFYEFSKQQAVLGVVFEGMQLLGDRLKGHINQKLLLEWYAAAMTIQRNNRLLNQRAVQVTQLFADAGMRSCILKGQGNTLMYPWPLARTSGDIDIWVEGEHDVVRQFVKQRCPDAHDGSQHIDFPVFSDAVVEVHYRASHATRPRDQRRLLEWFAKQADEQYSHKARLPETDADVSIPWPAFNVVQQLSHLRSHFFVEGIGLRQFIDYYFVLKHAQRKGDEEKLLDYLGMLKFAKGVMWIEHACLGLDRECLTVEPDEKVGRFILTELLEGGNFGWYDQRYATRKLGYLARGITDVVRLFRLATVFPSDALWKILRKISNQRWKLQ